MIIEQDVDNWLRKYGVAWIDRDPSAAAALFTQSATYQETPFDSPLVARKSIRNYWQEGAADSQRDVTFCHQLWGVNGDFAFAGWQASFRRFPANQHVTLDGVFHLQFQDRGSSILCSCLREWWHRSER